jgi:ParB family chromosome partitioning protein
MKKSNEKLGRSLSDLLKDESLLTSVELLQKDKSLAQLLIPLDQIVPNPFQPRQNFDPIALQELADSIKEHGILTPILVRRRANKYEIVAGERRFRASKLANKTSIPAIVQEFDDLQMSEIALIENIQRENLSPLEEARAYAELQKKYNCTQEQLAKKVGKSRPYIANILRLRTLPIRVQKELEKQNLSVGHVRTLIGLEEEEALAYIEQIQRAGLNVRETERLVSAGKTRPKSRQLSPIKQKERALGQKLDAQVQVAKGEIKIKYKSHEELDEILAKIMKDK